MERTIVNQESFRDWKSNPVTKAVMSDLAQRVNNLQIDLGLSAGVDPSADRFKAGAIQAYTDLLNITFEDTKGD